MKLPSISFILLMIFCCILSFSGIIKASQEIDLTAYPTFQNYISTFNKIYTETQKIQRKQIYHQNLIKIKKDNKNWQGVNQFTDKSSKQIFQLFTTKPSEKKSNIAATNITINKADLPASFDWRVNKALTKIKDQNGCSSSWAFSAIAFFQYSSIVNGQTNTSLDLSEQFLLSCDEQNHGCNGGDIPSAMDSILHHEGVPKQSQYQYSPFKIQDDNICTDANVYSIPSETRLSYYKVSNQDLIKKVLLKKPVNIGVCGNDFTFYSPTINQTGTRTLRCQPQNKKINHAVLLIGYTQTQWIVKNSWGEYWGLNGFAYISQNSLYDCCIGDEMHTTGVTTLTCTVTGCQKCIDQKTCVKCANNKWVSINNITSEQTCNTCSESNCNICHNYYGSCKQCKQGYTINEATGKCQLSTIQYCNIQRENTCSQCYQGYQLTQYGFSCKVSCDITHCNECSAGPCTQCKHGYSLVSSKCQINVCSVQNCNLCDSQGKCIQCKKYFNLANNTCNDLCVIDNCLDCDAGSNLCRQCDISKSFNIISRKCEAFNSLANCGFHIQSVCHQCRVGYDFNNFKTQCNQICKVKDCKSCQDSATATCNICRDGFELSAGRYTCTVNICTITGCQFCDKGNTVCYKCLVEGQLFNQTQKKCKNQIPCSIEHCSECYLSLVKGGTNKTKCVKCQTGFIPEQTTGNCYNSSIQNCKLLGKNNDKLECWDCLEKYSIDKSFLTCRLMCEDKLCQLCDPQTLSVCSECIEGYRFELTESGRFLCHQIESFIPHCELGSQDQTHCYQCEDYYVFKEDKISCEPNKLNCSDPFCQYCPSLEQKDHQIGCKCKKGYVFDVTSNKCLQNTFGDTCVLSGTFDSISICYKCQKGFILSSNFKSCVSICTIDNCIECYEGFNGFCAQCVYGYFQTSNWKCDKCKIQKCKKCNSMECFECEPGLQLSYDGHLCHSVSCPNGTIFDGNLCRCLKGNYLASNNICLPCSNQNCESCDQKICLICSHSYFFKSGNCTKCIQNCKQCDSSTNCLLCKDGYIFDEKSLKCMQIGINQRSFTFNGSIPLQCPIGCQKCDKNLMCTSCHQGFSLLKDNCLPCAGNCKTCYPNSAEKCLSCQNGYSLQESQCKKCSDKFCLNCQNFPNICTLCKKGFYLKDFACLTCSQNCQSCDLNRDCISCKLGYALQSDKSCEQCASSCKQCNPTALYQCLNYCLDGFYLKDSNCQACSNNCKMCNSLQICTHCHEGYLLRNSSCVAPCDNGCYECENSNSSICKTCFAGYQLNVKTFKCVPSIKCNLNNTCKFCPQGYALLLDSTCKICSSSNCIQCSVSDVTLCVQCSSKFYLTDGKCISCQSSCVNCLTADLCFSCSFGYYLLASEDENVGPCLACDSNCLTCKDIPTNCLSCSDKYEISSTNVCFRKERITLQIKLNMKLEDYFLKAKMLRISLLGLLGQKYKTQTKYLIINTIKAGSIILDAQLAVPENENSQVIFKSVSSSLTSGSTLGDVPILSVSQISLTSEQILSFDDDRNKTIIIVLCTIIPSLAIILVLYCIVRRENKTSVQSNENRMEKQYESDMSNHQIIKNKNDQSIFMNLKQKQPINFETDGKIKRKTEGKQKEKLNEKQKEKQNEKQKEKQNEKQKEKLNEKQKEKLNEKQKEKLNVN